MHLTDGRRWGEGARFRRQEKRRKVLALEHCLLVFPWVPGENSWPDLGPNLSGEGRGREGSMNFGSARARELTCLPVYRPAWQDSVPVPRHHFCAVQSTKTPQGERNANNAKGQTSLHVRPVGASEAGKGRALPGAPACRRRPSRCKQTRGYSRLE